MLAVSDHRRGCSQRGTDELIIDHEAAKIETRNESFDDNAAAIFLGGGEGLHCLFPCSDVSSIALAMISIDGFYDQRIPEPINRLLQSFLGSYDGSPGHGYLGRFQ